MALQVEVVSPEKILYSGQADMIVCRTTEGEVAFLTGHAPFVSLLSSGEVRIHRSNEPELKVQVDGGVVEVSDDRVTVLSDAAQLVETPG